jgi:hypothetical protein
MTRVVGGGTAVVLASAQALPSGMVLDAMAIYWTDQLDGTVMRLAK